MATKCPKCGGELIQTTPKDGIIYDIVYNPTKTELIKQAIKAERRTIGGLDMLVHQGARATGNSSKHQF